MNETEKRNDSCAVDNAWRRLYNISEKIESRELWNTFCEVDLAEIYLHDDEEPYYCSLSGMHENPRGISVYSGSKGLLSFSYYINGLGAGGVGARTAEGKRTCLECTWGPRKDLRKRDMDILKACGKTYRGAEAWPLYRKHETGYEPWFMNDDEAALMADVLEQFEAAASELAEDGRMSLLPAGFRIRRRFDKDRNGYVTDFAPPIDKIEGMTEGCIITDELLIRRLKKQPYTGGTLEFDMPYLPMSVKGRGKDKRPFFPRMCIVCDTEKMTIDESYMVGRHEEVRDVALGVMIQHMENRGRPGAIYVRDPEIYGVIAHLCSSIEVDLYFTPSLHMLDYFVNDMIMTLTNTDIDDL